MASLPIRPVLPKSGFTLIELSIVLVIIGLIVGGVLVGRDLIASAAVRAQISQIEKYNQAVNTFRGKYGYLPGDIPVADAARFALPTPAFDPLGGVIAGNGILESYSYTQGGPSTTSQGCYETGGFWADLSSAKLIANNFSAGNAGSACPTDIYSWGATPQGLQFYMPGAVLGNNNAIFVYSYNSVNWYGLAAGPLGVDAGDNAPPYTPALTPAQAYAIDKKMDDGMPTSGAVVATFAGVGTVIGAAAQFYQGASNNSATPGANYTCYDNSSAASGTPGVGGATQHYSLEMNNGMNMTCELSFKLQ